MESEGVHIQDRFQLRHMVVQWIVGTEVCVNCDLNLVTVMNDLKYYTILILWIEEGGKGGRAGGRKGGREKKNKDRQKEKELEY